MYVAMIGQILNVFNAAIGAIFMLCYAYQVVFLLISLVTKPKKYPDAKIMHRYAFLISARNEEKVIPQLCDSIYAQNYPRELIDIYVIADNCSDNTAMVARERGAFVVERQDPSRVGKGYALEALFDHIDVSVGYDAYDGYIIIDADNILDSDFVLEMNKCFDSGEKIITGYRNTKNYGENWLSQGYSVWYMREMRQLNAVRGLLGTAAELRGTGFLVSSEIIKKQGGWPQHLLIEDVQFAVEKTLEGERIAYCHDAIFYDEQPTSFLVSWWQRRRWCRGYLQILKRYGTKLVASFFRGYGFSHLDMIMSMSPAFFITVFAAAINIVALILTLIFEVEAFIYTALASVNIMIASYIVFFAVGMISVITERKRIRATAAQKILSCIVFPVFMATYVPIAAVSLFKDTEWKAIKHKPLCEKEKGGIITLPNEK